MIARVFAACAIATSGCGLIATVAEMRHPAADGEALVVDVRIEGYDLVVERCRDPHRRVGCFHERKPLPFVPPRSVETRGAAQREPAFRAIADARDALARCATVTAVRGLVRVELSVDANGRATASRLSPNDAELARCVVASFATTSFTKPSIPTVTFWFRVPEPPPPIPDAVTP